MIKPIEEENSYNTFDEKIARHKTTGTDFWTKNTTHNANSYEPMNSLKSQNVKPNKLIISHKPPLILFKKSF